MSDSGSFLVVFDLDGTLVDSARDLADAGNALVTGYGAAPLPPPEVIRMVGDGARELVRRLLTACHLDVPLDVVDSITVPVVALDGWLAAEGLARVDAFKLDTQGFEGPILEGAGTALGTVRVLEIEVLMNVPYSGFSTRSIRRSAIAKRMPATASGISVQ